MKLPNIPGYLLFNLWGIIAIFCPWLSPWPEQMAIIGWMVQGITVGWVLHMEYGGVCR